MHCFEIAVLYPNWRQSLSTQSLRTKWPFVHRCGGPIFVRSFSDVIWKRTTEYISVSFCGVEPLLWSRSPSVNHSSRRHATRSFNTAYTRAFNWSLSCHMKPVHTAPLYLSNSHFVVIPPLTSRSSRGLPTLMLHAILSPRFMLHALPTSSSLTMWGTN